MEFRKSNESKAVFKKFPHTIAWQFIKIYLVYLLQSAHQI